VRSGLECDTYTVRKPANCASSEEPLNAFEAEVFDCLSAKGLKLIPQMAASRFRIDMDAEHPT
jgi:hypothetical protein